MAKTPRFIAGAICPSCQVMDRILIEEVDGVTQRRCVNCNFQEQWQPGTGQPLRSRLERPKADRAVEQQPVRIVTPAPRKPDS